MISLSKFRPTNKLQEAVIVFLVGQLASKKEINNLKKVFIFVDSNGNGTLTKEELVSAWEKAFEEDHQESVNAINNIFDFIDIDGNGTLDYSEWIIATINLQKLFHRKNLKIIYGLFDKDNSGAISAEEIKKVLMPDNVLADDMLLWDKILAEVDLDGSGEIDFHEFSVMM